MRIHKIAQGIPDPPEPQYIERHIPSCPICHQKAVVTGANGGDEYAIGCNNCKNWVFDGLLTPAANKWLTYVMEYVPDSTFEV